jgi:hypothetical protein
MPIRIVSGDPILTRAQTLAFGYNAKGKNEVMPLETDLRSRYPAAFSAYSKLCRSGRISAGTTWTWSESFPQLMFFVVREAAVGTTRLRHVQSIALALVRDYQLEGLTSLAIAPLGRDHEWPELKRLLETWLAPSPLLTVLYTSYQPGVQADEGV